MFSPASSRNTCFLFEDRIQKALTHVKKVLEATKHPTFAEDVHHTYQDKYSLAEFLTSQAIASKRTCLSVLSKGVLDVQMQQLHAWASTNCVTLRFQSSEYCSFDRKVERDVEHPTKQVTSIISPFDPVEITHKVVTTVTEYIWKHKCSFEIVALRGVGEQEESRICLCSWNGEVEIKSTSDKSPFPEVRSPAVTFDANMTWFLQRFDDEGQNIEFKIDRDDPKCHTPSRNACIQHALKSSAGLSQWSRNVQNYIRQLFVRQPDHQALNLSSLDNDAFLLVPILPVLSQGDLSVANAEQNQIIEKVDQNRLIEEERRSLKAREEALAKEFQRTTGFITGDTGMLAVSLMHLGNICQQYEGCIHYIEELLRKQLIAAIGKEVTPADFAEYMHFHDRRLFAQRFMPSRFVFAVRRSQVHTPEGTLSIEHKGVDAIEPIVTMAAKSEHPQLMEFALNAATSVSFEGDRYLHAWLQHEFSTQQKVHPSLVCRARQFSSMIVLIGRVTSATTFDPKFAAIVQNKDELEIPLELATIPSAKEFKDAIESLSPQQQAFAKAFRGMQLESTLFGILSIQIKPQLEQVLNLPEDSLTKEIKLTQDLMQLFIKYQIPSDLLSYESIDSNSGFEIAAPSAKEQLEAVKAHVQAIHEMIGLVKKEEIDDRRKEAAWTFPSAAGGGAANDFDVFHAQGMMMPMMMPPGGMDCDLLGGSAMLNFSAPPPAMFGGSTMGGGGGGGGFGAPPPALLANTPPKKGMALGKKKPAAVSAALDSAASLADQPQAQQTIAECRQLTVVQQPPTELASTPPTVAGCQRDYTQVPIEMDRRFEELDLDGALRPTIITPGSTWTKKEQKALLAQPSTSSLSPSEQTSEKDAAFDLLDALTKSGALTVKHASLHIIVAATHCFDKTIIETVVQDNINPIEKVERSSLVMASTVHQVAVDDLIQQSQKARLVGVSPMLFLE